MPPAASPSLARATDFALRLRPGDIPAPVMARAARLLLDTLGVCIAASALEAGRLARDTAHRIYNAPQARDRATLLFDGRTASRPGAAFAAATQIDNLDAHDGYNPTKGHIGVAAIPALIAEAEHCADLTGPDALAALVVGYEIAGRAGIALHASVSDYHTSGAWNALGVAAIAARLRGMSAASLRQAWGIAEYHGPRSQMMREIANPTMLHDGSGQGALVGLSAATLAEAGFSGAPAITVEAPESAAFWSDLGKVWQVEGQYIKPYPVCRWAHAAIDGASEIRAAHRFGPGEIERVEVRSFDYAVRLFPGLPATTSEAQYSLPFAVAAMLVHGQLGVAEITGDGLRDARVAALLPRIAIISDPRHEARYPEGRWADVTVVLKDGRRLVTGDIHARGGPENPMSDAELIRKFLDFAGPVVGIARAEAIRDAALALPEAACAFSGLSSLLFAPP